MQFPEDKVNLKTDWDFSPQTTMRNDSHGAQVHMYPLPLPHTVAKISNSAPTALALASSIGALVVSLSAQDDDTDIMVTADDDARMLEIDKNLLSCYFNLTEKLMHK